MMTLDPIQTTSGAIQSLLIRAWRERWSDVQWGIQIKTLIHRGCTGDTYQLSQILLNQALMGPSPNGLVLGFLRHSLASQVVSHASVLSAVAAFQDWHKPHGSGALLDLITSAQGHVTCKGRPEDCVQLAVALLQVHGWLLQLLSATFQRLERLRDSKIDSRNYRRAVDALTFFTQSDFGLTLLYIGRGEDRETHSQVVAAGKKVADLARQAHLFDQEPAALKVELNQILTALKAPEPMRIPSPPVPMSHVGSLQPMLAYEALLHPTSDLVSLSRQIYAYGHGQSLSFAELAFQVLQSCLVSFSPHYQFDVIRWDAFLFWRLPTLIEQLALLMKVETAQLKTPTDLYQAFEKLLSCHTLLNAVDAGGECNIIKILLGVLGRISPRLMTETEVDDVLNGRAAKMIPPPEPKTMTGVNPDFNEYAGMPSRKIELTLKAESTMDSILMTLDTDYTKPDSMEDLLGVLAHIIQGDSADKLLGASVAIGKFPEFIRSMVKFNQQAQESQGESVKNSLLRAALFDMTFLMLIYSAQRSGSEMLQIVLAEAKGTFVEGWLRDMFIEDGNVKPIHQDSPGENTMVDNLLQQLHSGDLRTQVVKWQNVCANIHLAMKEMVFASSSKMLDANSFKKMTQTLCSKLCALPVCVLTWLISYKSCVADSKLRMGHIIHEFLILLDQEEVFVSDMPHKTERLALMRTILSRVLKDVGIVPQSASFKSQPPSLLANNSESLNIALKKEWIKITTLGRLEISNAYNLLELYKTGGAIWFTSVLIDELFSIVYQDQLDKWSNLLVSIFHIDLEQCTLALLLRVIPAYLTCRNKKYRLTDPHGTTVAKVLVSCLYSVLIPDHLNFKNPAKPGKKRSIAQTDWENDLPTAKMHKILGDIGEEESSATPSSSFSALPNTHTPKSELNKDDFNGSTVSQATKFFLTVLHAISQESTLTPAVHFTVKFLEQAALQGKSKSRLIFHHLNTQTILTLIKIVPELFTIGFAAQLFDNSSSTGRKNMARTICLLRNIHRKRDLTKGES
ncbi:mediator of RNA polymerase II transcription subunit 24-like isoform X1 [Tigriopus californicus]|uniref:mediator of RNA polymerase II transcription subunit 24-like isoform X1 n=1 Tax=Tigriopus californicus TaxID=6832 RepID=UPI0027DA6442|nr:mediator of RNA polymerase II transcription subunit 24-like isoform X1 [Tigriopus californicus]